MTENLLADAATTKALPLPQQDTSPADGPPPPPEQFRVHIARAELTLALPDHLSLREVPLNPDPLAAVAAAFADVREGQGERVDIVLDLLPISAAQVARRRNRLYAQARRRPRDAPSIPGMPSTGAGRGLGAIGAEIAREMRGSQPGHRPTFQLPVRSTDVKTGMGKFAPSPHGSPVFALQLLVRACAGDKLRARILLDQAVAALDIWAGDNHLRPVGLNLGVTRIRADAALYRKKFDERFATGAFDPRQRRWVTAAEIAGLLKPPTVSNAFANVARSGGSVPPPPVALPTWDGQKDLLPLGWVETSGGGERLVGAPLKYLLFGLFLGKSGYGKTEMSLVQAIALAHNGHGCLFFDPHGDGWKRARPYLAHAELARRIWEIDLTSPKLNAYAASWNPLSMVGRRRDDIPDLVGAVVTGFATALNWTDSAGRAKTILTRSIESLVELSWKFASAGRPDLAPTVFQLRTILSDAEWRTAVVPYLPKNLQDFWNNIFPKYPRDAAPVVINIIERLDSSNALKAFLGASQSTYDIRTAMDTGKVVFVCPSGTGDTDRIISCLLIYDLFRAGLSRRNIDAADRRDFYTWIDELTAVDGASKGSLAAITEQLRKYRVKLLAMTQMAQRLTQTTRQGLLQNLSVLSTTASDIDEALLVTKRWGNQVEPDTIATLRPYHYVMSVTLDDGATTPFRVRGASVEEIYADYYQPEYEKKELTKRVNKNLRRRRVHKLLADQATLDDRIKKGLAEVLKPALKDASEDDLHSQSPKDPAEKTTVSTTRTSGAAGPVLTHANPAEDGGGSAQPATADEAPATDATKSEVV
ncbi:MAG: ATP/GTP-binding protein [Streptomycetaceae bacterium]|nr:ATP/GTP-binding protein [Streptomycetaceae bacterium]